MYTYNPARGVRRQTTSLIFPTFNAEARVERTWREVKHFLRWAPGNWEVLFVCDGCTDDTPAHLLELSSVDRERVRVITYPENRGKGHAVYRGLAEARGQWRVFTDFDLAYGFDDILVLAKTLQDGADVVVASRNHPESRLLLPARLQGYIYRRHLQSLAFSLLVRLLLPLRLRDTQAGLKGFSARAVQLVLPHMRCHGFEFDCELLTACVRFGLPIIELPVCVRYEDSASTTSVGSVAHMVCSLLRIRQAWRSSLQPDAPRSVEAALREAA